MRRRTFLRSVAALPFAPQQGLAQPSTVQQDQGASPRPPGGRPVPTEQRLELVVVGGGVAGLCAAIAAARCGARTAIIQDRPVFGGNSSSEIRVIPLGAAHNQAWCRETGIFEELILEDRATNHSHLSDYGLTNTRYDLVLYEAVLGQPNLTMFLNTSVRAVQTEPGGAGARRIISLSAVQLGTEKELVFVARQYADCTGDATVGYLAGAEFRYGREARAEFKEPLAPLESDRITMGSSLLMQARNIGRPAPYRPPSWIKIYKTAEDLGPGRPVSRVQGSEFGGYWWIELCDPFDQVADTQEMKDELLRHVLGVWNYIKNWGPERDQATNYALEWVGMVPGKRESRRLVGDVTVTEHDCHHDRLWPDRVCYAGWTVDIHTPKGILDPTGSERGNIDRNYLNWIRVPPFTLPLRAFYSCNIENLWMVGRNISVTHVALGATRLQRSHGLAGQAVGTAAAYAIAHEIMPRQAAGPEHIARIQQQLLRDDVHVFGIVNTDPADIARTAKATATSEAVLSFGEPLERFEQLDRPLAQVFPMTHDHVDNVEFYLKNDGMATEVTAELEEMGRIWDCEPGKRVAVMPLQIASRFRGWVTAAFQVRVAPGKPYRVILRGAPGVGWAQTSAIPTGTTAQFLHVAPGGCEPQHCGLPGFSREEMDIPPYRHWMQEKTLARAIRVTPAPAPFGPANVNNGVAWPVDMPNLWISDPAMGLPQWVELDFGESKTVAVVLVSFDTDMNVSASQAPAFWRSPTCARHWRLYMRIDGTWHRVFEEQDNYHRRRTVKFAPIQATGLKLEVVATQGTGHQWESTARVYEIRAYGTQV